MYGDGVPPYTVHGRPALMQVWEPEREIVDLTKIRVTKPLYRFFWDLGGSMGAMSMYGDGVPPYIVHCLSLPDAGFWNQGRQ